MNTRFALLSMIFVGLTAIGFSQAQKPAEKTAPPKVQAKPAVTETDSKQLTVVREHLQNALASMREAMGIYGGARARAIAAANTALHNVEQALNIEPEAKKKPAAKEPAKAQAATKPTVAKSQAEKVADSQAAMTRGQKELEAAAKELESAETWTKSEAGAATSKTVQTATEQAKASIALVSKTK